MTHYRKPLKNSKTKQSLSSPKSTSTDEHATHPEANILGTHQLDPDHVLQLQRTMGNHYVVDNVTNGVQHKLKSTIPNIKMAQSNPSAIQPKLVNDQNEPMTLDDLKREFAGTEYENKLKDHLENGAKVHTRDGQKDQEALKKMRERETKDVALNERYEKFVKKHNQLFPVDDKGKGRKPAPKMTRYIPLYRAIDPKNPMYFTLQNVRDFLDGEKVAGISDLDAGDIKGGTDEVLPYNAETGEQWDAGEYDELTQLSELGDDTKAREHAKTIVATLTRMKANRERYAEQTQNIEDGVVPEDAEPEIKLLADTFKNTTFFYGTTGELALNKVKFESLFKRVKKIKKERLGDKAGSYSAGMRTMGFMEAAADDNQNAQMMDMYYGGQEFEAWHMMANPVIAKYVHEMMGYAGEYKHDESMDTTFRKNFPLGGGAWGQQGWSKNSKPNFGTGENETDTPENQALRENVPEEWQGNMSGTMEISRIIREAVQKFGGTIVFEGSEIYNQGHFVEGAYKGDTNVEAEALLPYFAQNPGQSSVDFGAGTLIFHWHGTPVAPVRNLFLKNWAFPQQQGREVIHDNSYKIMYYQVNKTKDDTGTVTDIAVEQKLDRPTSLYWKFPYGEGDGKPRENLDLINANTQEDNDTQ